MPLLASRVFFANTVDDNAGLRYVQWTYLVVAGFCHPAYYPLLVSSFPGDHRCRDQEALEAQISEHGEDTVTFKKQYNLFFGVWSQLCYVGAQVAMAVIPTFARKLAIPRRIM